MFLVFDIGGTKTRVAISKDGESLSEPKIFDTPPVFEDGIKRIVEAAGELSAGEPVKAAAGGVSGTLDTDKSSLFSAPHLSGWKGKPVKSELEKVLNMKVFLQNDAAMVGLGEAVKGAGKGYNIVAYVTISTGVGGARIVDGKIDDNAMGFEPGHQIIDINGEACPTCGNKGDLESLVSGSAVERRFGKKPYEILDGEFWEEMARTLAYGLYNTVLHWSPDIIVLGGSMMKEIGIKAPRAEYYLSKLLTVMPKTLPVVKGILGDTGGLAGSLEFLKNAKRD